MAKANTEEEAAAAVVVAAAAALEAGLLEDQARAKLMAIKYQYRQHCAGHPGCE